MAIRERRFAREVPLFVAAALVQVGGPVIAAQHQSGYDAPPPVGVALLVVGLAATDDDRHRWNQQSLTAGRLADRYGFTDTDGTRPDAWRYIADHEINPDVDPARYR